MGFVAGLAGHSTVGGTPYPRAPRIDSSSPLAGCELALLAGDQVLEPTGKRIGLHVAAYFQDAGTPAGVLGFRVENHD